jgi:hypothetical protein
MTRADMTLVVFERTVPTASYISSCKEDFTVSIFTPETVCTFAGVGSSFLAHPKKRKGRTQKTKIRILFILNLNEFGTQICADGRRKRTPQPVGIKFHPEFWTLPPFFWFFDCLGNYKLSLLQNS